MRSLRWARMCYDHLAGTVGVAVTETLLERGVLCEQGGGYMVAPTGAELFGALGIDIGQLPRRGRPLARPCMDWSERRYHLAGSLGTALAGSLAERDWIRPQEGSRIVTVTPAGVAGLGEWLGVDLEQLRAVA